MEPRDDAEAGPALAAFTEHERRETGKAVFVYTSYHGDVGPPPPPPPPLPPVRVGVDEPDDSGGSSALSSVFVMANSTVGAGVLSLPFAFQATGLLGGILLCFVVGTAEALTLYVLAKFAERYEATTYVELVRRALGRKLAAVLSGVLVVAMFGACLAYMIILADNFSSLASAAGLPAWATDRHHIIAVLGTFVMLPMCLP
ncbi:putative sodium-coupled neutral amino acid transporter 7, partial [Tetrabaena socialis]